MGLTITTNYAGESAGVYVGAALTSGSTLANKGISIKPNVKYKLNLKKVLTSGIVGDASCDFTNAGNITLSDRVLEPKSLQVNVELCKADFRSDWDAIEMGYSAWDTLPKSFADFIIANFSESVAEATETSIWTGDDSNAGEFDGYVTLATADADVIDVTGTTVTASNVLDELGKVVDAIPAKLRTKADLTLYVSANVAAAYVRALGGFGTAGIGANGVDGRGSMWYGGQALSFDGIPVFVANGMDSDTMMAARVSNLYFGTGLMNDSQRVQLIDMTELDGSDNVRIIMKYTAGVNYVFGNEIVLYS